METTYCDKCGLLHDPSDGECLGCGMVSEIKQKDQRIKELEARVEEMGGALGAYCYCCETYRNGDDCGDCMFLPFVGLASSLKEVE